MQSIRELQLDKVVYNCTLAQQQTSIQGGGGQPNMKLRMEVMLERIKRDFT